MVKALLPNQCAVLHYYYSANDCCLCKERTRVVELENEVELLKEQLEKSQGDKRMHFTDELGEFLSGLERRGGNKYIWESDGDSVKIILFTDNYTYTIRATENYLGCGVSCRKPRPGEDWTRGNDLADGRFCRETWDKILKDIIAYELVSIPKREDSVIPLSKNSPPTLTAWEDIETSDEEKIKQNPEHIAFFSTNGA